MLHQNFINSPIIIVVKIPYCIKILRTLLNYTQAKRISQLSNYNVSLKFYKYLTERFTNLLISLTCFITSFAITLSHVIGRQLASSRKYEKTGIPSISRVAIVYYVIKKQRTQPQLLLSGHDYPLNETSALDDYPILRRIPLDQIQDKLNN